MALPASGSISIASIATEHGGTVPHSFSEYYRGSLVANGPFVNNTVPTSGSISSSNFYSTIYAKVINVTNDTTVTNINLNTVATANGWNGNSAVVLTYTNNNIIGSTSTATYALNIGTWPTGSIVRLINNHYIVGRGGNGGANTGGWFGGPALNIPSSPGATIYINNNHTIGGGGGGGAAGSYGTAGFYCGGSGGAGHNVGLGVTWVQTGLDGTLTTGGAAVYYGGKGGDLGIKGNDAINVGWAWAIGGSPGNCIVGNANITWNTVGTLLGPRP